MKKINLKWVSETLSEREMKDVKGGEVFQIAINDTPTIDAGARCTACDGKRVGDSCTCPTISGYCRYAPFVYHLICG
jgi:natural product precursor